MSAMSQTATSGKEEVLVYFVQGESQGNMLESC